MDDGRGRQSIGVRQLEIECGRHFLRGCEVGLRDDGRGIIRRTGDEHGEGQHRSESAFVRERDGEFILSVVFGRGGILKVSVGCSPLQGSVGRGAERDGRGGQGGRRLDVDSVCGIRCSHLEVSGPVLGHRELGRGVCGLRVVVAVEGFILPGVGGLVRVCDGLQDDVDVVIDRRHIDGVIERAGLSHAVVEHDAEGVGTIEVKAGHVSPLEISIAICGPFKRAEGGGRRIKGGGDVAIRIRRRHRSRDGDFFVGVPGQGLAVGVDHVVLDVLHGQGNVHGGFEPLVVGDLELELIRAKEVLSARVLHGAGILALPVEATVDVSANAVGAEHEVFH